MNKMFALLVVLAASLGFSACSKPPYENLDNAQLKTLIEQGVPLYDVRRPEEWKQTGVVEGSRLLTWVDGSGRVQPGFFENLAAESPKDKPVVIICRTGNRTSQLARELMEKHGYTKVYNVKDGITGWIANGNPVDR
jgi:rhodanese-related sulfurtransferase